MTSKAHKLIRIHAAICACVLITVFEAPAQTSSATSGGASSLVSQLSKGLSITRPQARGGAGSLFALAKSRLSSDEFSKISSAVPGMSSLLKAAPPSGQSSELSALEGSLPGNMGRMAEVAGAFHKLGLSPEMAGKFLPIMSKFVESRGGSSTASLLEKALK
jgi:Protein of unknown function VcgC/VcgE (DUF2780)